MPIPIDLREVSRLWLQRAMAKSSRRNRHALARQAIRLARVAAKIERGQSLTDSEEELAAEATAAAECLISGSGC